MTTVGVLDLSLRVRTQKLISGLKKAADRVDKFTGRVGTAAWKVGGFGLALGAAETAATLLMARFQAAEVDKISKFAQRIGASTEALSGYAHAAQMTGVSQEQLFMGLQRMTRRLSEAAKGSGEAQGAIQELGLDIDKLASMRPEEQFEVIADALDGVKNQSDRVRLAMKFFDSEGVSLLQTMKGGSAALQEYRKEAEALGLTFTEIDGSKIQMANDAWERMKALTKGFSRILAIEIAPLVETILSKIQEYRKQGGDLRKEVQSFIRMAIRGVTRVSMIIGGALKGIFHLGEGIFMFFRMGITKVTEFASRKALGFVEMLLEKVTKLPDSFLSFLGIDKDDIHDAITGIRRYSRELGNELKDIEKKTQKFTRESFGKAGELIHGGITGNHQIFDDIDQMFADIQKRAEEHAKKIAAMEKEKREAIEGSGLIKTEAEIESEYAAREKLLEQHLARMKRILELNGGREGLAARRGNAMPGLVKSVAKPRSPAEEAALVAEQNMMRELAAMQGRIRRPGESMKEFEIRRKTFGGSFLGKEMNEVRTKEEIDSLVPESSRQQARTYVTIVNRRPDNRLTLSKGR